MNSKTKPEETYSIRQIVQVVKDIYSIESHLDDWSVPVVYEKTFIKELKSRLKHIKEFVK